MARRVVRGRLASFPRWWPPEKYREDDPVRARGPHERRDANVIAGERGLDEAKLRQAEVQVRMVVGHVRDVVVHARKARRRAVGALVPGHLGEVRRHGRFHAHTAVSARRHPVGLLQAALELGYRGGVRRQPILLARGDEGLHPGQVAAHVIQHRLLLREDRGRVGPGRDGVAEDAPVDVERLRVRRHGLPGLGDVGLIRERRPVRERPRRHLVAIGAHVRGQPQRSERRRVGPHRSAEQRRIVEQQLIDRCASRGVVLAADLSQDRYARHDDGHAALVRVLPAVRAGRRAWRTPR